MLSLSSLSAQNTDGTDFWLTFGDNTNQAYNSSGLSLQIRIVSRDMPTKVTIRFTENGSEKVKNMAPNDVWTVPLNSAERNLVYNRTTGSETFKKNSKSVFIHSEYPVTAYALNQYELSTDATNLMPLPALGSEYYHIGYTTNGNYKDAYAVIATEDNTKIFHGSTHVETLNEGEVYYRSLQNGDMTGTHIHADKNIAYFSLASRVCVPHTNTSSRDHFFQQLAPVHTWSTDFFAPASHIGKSRIRIVCSEDNTNIITLQGGVLLFDAPLAKTQLNNLNSGDFIEIEVGNSGCHFAADKRVGACALFVTASETNYKCGCNPSPNQNSNCGDPSLAWLPSMAQKATRAMISPFIPATITNLCEHYALIITPTETKIKTTATKNEVSVSLPNTWVDHAESGMSSLSYKLSNDQNDRYAFYNKSGVIVMGYGDGYAESYYYLGYSSMRKLDAYFTADDGVDVVHYQNFPDEILCSRDIEFSAEFIEPQNVDSLKWYIGTNPEPVSTDFIWTHTFPSAGAYLVKMKVYFKSGDIGIFEETLNVGAHISVSPNPSNESLGTVTPMDTCIKVGETLTLVATPATDCIFLGWTNILGDTISKDEIYTTFFVDKDSVIVGHFKLNNFNINVSSNNNNYGTATCNGTGDTYCEYPYDATITVYARPAHCYKFLYWMEADTIVLGADTAYTFDVKGDRDLIAHFAKLKYDISVSTNPAVAPFDAHGGELQKDCGTQVTVSTQNVTCYKFLGWTNANIPPDTVSKNLSFTFTLESDTALTANFAILPYTVTLYSDPLKGSVTGDGDYDCGEEVTVEAFSTTCYTFLKWTNAKGDSITNANPFKFYINQDSTLTANYTLNSYNIVVSADPAVGNNTVSANGGNPGCDNTIALFAFADDCYEFVKWETLSGDSVTNANPYIFTIKKDSTLVAKFKIKTYNVNIALTVNPPASGTATGGGFILCGDDATVTALPDSCHTFVKWTNFLTGDSISGANPYTFEVTGNRDFVANFKRKTYDIVVSASHPVGNNTVSGAGTKINCGISRTITATVDECYNFVNWTLGGVPVSTNLSHTFNLNGDSTYVANYAIKKYNVSVQTNTPAVTGNAVTNNYTNVNCGDTRSFTATADPCYTFTNWTDQHNTVVSTSPNFTLTVKSDSTLTANFAIKKFSVAISKSPVACDGTVAITTGLATNNNCGDPITITATNSYCFSFEKWVEKGTGTFVSNSATYTFDISANRDLVAVFTQKTYSLSVQKNTPTNNHVTGSNPVAPCGELSTIVAIPDVFHTFFHWTDLNHVVISTNNVEQINVLSDTSLIAVFMPKTYNILVSSSSAAGGSVTGGGMDVPYNTSMTVTATANPPLYKFSHWEDYGSKVNGAGPTYTFPVTGDRNLVAVFAKETVIIKVIAEPDTGGMAYQSAYKVELDSLCYVWATPSFCQHFTHWSLLDHTVLTVQDTLWFTPEFYYLNIVNGVLTFVAHFMPNTYHIEVSPFPYEGGDVYINNILGGGDGDFTCDTEIEIKAVATHPKYRFVEWVEVIGTDTTWVSNDSIHTFVVRADRKLIARFELIQYQITLIPNPGGGGTVSGGGPFPYNTNITVHAEAFDEWTFYNWTENGVPVSSNPSGDFNFTVTRDRTLHANFIPKTYTVKVIESPAGIGGIVTGNGTNIDYGTLWDITATALHPYVFSHWEENGTPYYSWPANHTIAVNRDFDLTAVFVLKEYEITLESDPATGGTTTGGGTFVHGTVISVEAFEAVCHTFSHWTDNGVTVGSLPVFTFTVTGPRDLVAHFIPEMFNITLSADPVTGGTPTGDGSKACLSEVTIFANTDDCYDFVGWFEADTLLSDEPDYTFIVDAPRDFTAHYVQKLFNITTSVDPNVAPPGSGYIVVSGGDDTDIPCGEDRTVEAFAEIGYYFTHWTINGVDEFTNPYTINITEDNDVVAHFTPAEYDIVLYADPHYGGKAITSDTYPHGLMLTVHAIPNPEYVFREWTEGGLPIPGAGANYTFFVDKPRVLTAHFDTATFTVTTSALPLDGGFTFGDDTDIPYNTFITVTAEPKDCFIFDHWSIDGVWKSDEPEYTFPVKQNCHLVAHFKKETYNIILKKNPPLGGTAVVVDKSGENIACGDSITIKATPFSNYNFENWTDKTGVVFSANATHKLSVTQDDTLTANFELKKYDVIVSVAPGGGGQVLQNYYGVTHGDLIDISATHDQGYKFLYWKEFGQTDVFSPLAVITNMPVHKSMHLVAYFEPETYRIQLKADPGNYAGTATGNLPGEYFPFGTYFIATALEIPPYFSWDRWTDENNITVELNRSFGFNVTESRILIAHFTTVSFEIEVSADPDIGGTVDGGGEYDYGLTIPLTATPNLPCYEFAGWYEDDVWVTNENPFMFTVDGPHHFVAHFEQQEFNITTSVFPTPASGTVVVTGGAETDIICGEERIIEAIGNLGYRFEYWMINGTQVFFNPHTISVEEDLDIVAHFEYVVHHVTLAPKPGAGGQVYGEGYYPHNKEILVRAVAKTGFMFIEWQEEDTVVFGAGADYTFNVLKDRHLVAIFDSAKYRVTTKAEPTWAGITTPIDTTGLAHQSLLTVKAMASADYTFKHWKENDIPILSAPANYQFPVTQNRDLVAVFEPKKYTVTVGYSPPGSGTVGGGGYNVPYGSTVPLEAYANTNYDFFQWENEAGDPIYASPIISDHPVTKTEHLTAIFTPKKYDLLVSVSSGSTGYGTACCSHFNVPYPETKTIRADAYEGYVFAGWWEGDTTFLHKITPWTVPVTGNRHLVARFVKGTYHIILKANPPKGGKVIGGGYDFEYGDIIPIEAIENSCYNFENWTNENGTPIGGSKLHYHTVVKSDTLTANFTALTSKITLYSDPVGVGTLTADGKTGGGDFAQCDTIIISAEPTGCYTFEHWTENGSIFKTTPTFELAMNEFNRTFVAHFTQKHINVSVRANPEEGGLASGGATNLPCGEQIQLTAIANNGWHFVNWTLNGNVLSTSDDFLYTTTEAGEVVANFAKNQYTITVAANPTNLGAVTGGGNYDFNEEATVIATAKTGYMFVNWTEEGVGVVSTSANYTFTVTGDRDLTANFETTFYLVTVLSNDTLYGIATIPGFPSGVGKFAENDIATVRAYVKEGYRFLHWTIDDVIVSYKPEFDFTVTQDVTLTAHFYGLDFDTYAATLWENTFMLDLKKLAKEGLEVSGCRWFKIAKNSITIPLVPTNTVDEFSYSAGPKLTDKLDTDPTSYYFQITTQKGILLSTKKVLPFRTPYMVIGNNNLLVYPNPAESGMAFTVENVTAGTLLQVYNQFGVCVKSFTTKDNIVSLTLDLPAGLYLIRNENKEAKLIITK